MKLFKLKRKNIILVSLLVIAGFLGISSVAVSTATSKEAPVAEKAEAKTTTSAAGINVYLKDWSSNKLTSNGHDACLHLYNITWNSDAGYTTTGDWLSSGFAFDNAWWNYNNQSDFYLKMNWVNDNREYQVKLPWFIQSCTFNIFIQDGVDKYLRVQNNTQSYSNTMTLGYDYTITIENDSGYGSWWNGDIYKAGKVSYSGSYVDRKWDQTACTVTINSNGGSSVAPQTILLGKKPGYIPIPTYSDHTFLKYCETNDADADPIEVIADDCTIFAIWGVKYLYWKPSTDEGRVNPSTGKSWFDNWSYIYYADGDYTVGSFPGTTGESLTINGETHYRILLKFIPTLVIINNGTGSGDGNQTPDISCGEAYTDGSTFLNVGASKTDSSYTNEWRSWNLTITWKNGDTTLETDTGVWYLDSPSYDGSNPTKTQTAQYTYTWVGWNSSDGTEYGKTGLPAVTGDETYTARFSSTVRTYTVTLNRNNTAYGTLSSYSIANVPYGSTVTTSSNTITINGTTITATPTSAASGYSYSFSSWSNAPATITGAVTITANFTRTSGETAAIAFATGFNSSIGGICKYDESTNKEALASAWGSKSTNYSALPQYVKYWLDEKESTASSDSNVTEMFAKYKYVYGKYGTSLSLTDFLAGKLNAYAFQNYGRVSPFNLIGEDNFSTIIIIISSSVALLSVTALSILVIRKRKSKED